VSQEERSFKVQDRRRFSEDGAAREEVREEAEESERSEERREGPAAEAPEPAQEINFTTFVLSLSTEALAHLGEIPHPVEGSTKVDLVAATQIIDILGMLKEKTKGNLDNAESSLLDGVLYDLRMQYVARSRK
jgi:hypothetical protein